LYFEELLYKRGLTSIENSNKIEQDNIERHLRKFNIEPTVPIYADSSEPAEIQDLCNCGFNVVGAKKPAGSIIAGINTMKSYKLNIVSHSEKIITELNNYKWRVKRDGSPTNEPVDDFNHAIDAMRYTVYMTCKIKDNIIKNPYAHCKMNTNADRYSTF
jgi:phage terminase large subunit